MSAPFTAHLLVVDDNEMNRDMLSRRLERAGYNVSTAEDGASALAMLGLASGPPAPAVLGGVHTGAAPFDLVLLDIMMPGMDGFEVIRRIRAAYSAMHLPIIMSTAKDDRADVVEALKLGASDYVIKPLDLPVVLARVETQLRLKRAVDQVMALEQHLEHKNRELERHNNRMQRDLESAARVQRALLPSSAPAVPGLSFAWTYRPCDELAGDILNAFHLDEHHVCLYVLDVSGHGVPAALLSVTLGRLLAPGPVGGSLLHRPSSSGHPEPLPPHLLARELNLRFQMEEAVLQYFTLFYGVLDTRTLELRYICAGHPGPLHLPRHGPATLLDIPSYPIGLLPDAEYEQAHLTLEPGDRLYIYSDGLCEVMNSTGVQFGRDRLAAAAKAARGMPLHDSIEDLIRTAEGWSTRFDDDVSALALQVDDAAT